MMIKYPIHKVAKDFKRGSKELPSKEIMDILTQYGHPPKNHMQPLTDQEPSIVFEYLTQHNQVDSIESIYADVYHEPAAAKSAAPAPKQPAQGQQQAKSANSQPAKQLPSSFLFSSSFVLLHKFPPVNLCQAKPDKYLFC